tara:strand:- start:266 stop:754 length:489 start_codon:yes stop_codon:yes gene_type:complete
MTGIIKVDTIQSNGGTTAFTVNTEGYVARAKNAAFLAHTPSDATHDQDGVLGWDTEVFDTDSCFVPSTGLYTVPVNGIYCFNACILIEDTNFGVGLYYKNNATLVAFQSYSTGGNNRASSAASITIEMNASDTMGIYWYGSTYGQAFEGAYSHFSGHLLAAT